MGNTDHKQEVVLPLPDGAVVTDLLQLCSSHEFCQNIPTNQAVFGKQALLGWVPSKSWATAVLLSP